jgi:hypothetical protein
VGRSLLVHTFIKLYSKVQDFLVGVQPALAGRLFFVLQPEEAPP